MTWHGRHINPKFLRGLPLILVWRQVLGQLMTSSRRQLWAAIVRNESEREMKERNMRCKMKYRTIAIVACFGIVSPGFGDEKANPILAAGEGGKSVVGGAGPGDAIELKLFTYKIVDTLIREGIHRIAEIPLAELSKAMAGARIDTKDRKLTLGKDEVVDAINYPEEELIDLSSVTYPTKPEHIRQAVSIHEAIGLISLKTKIKDHGNLITYQILETYEKVKGKTGQVQEAAPPTFDEVVRQCYFSTQSLTGGEWSQISILDEKYEVQSDPIGTFENRATLNGYTVKVLGYRGPDRSTFLLTYAWIGHVSDVSALQRPIYSGNGPGWQVMNLSLSGPWPEGNARLGCEFPKARP